MRSQLLLTAILALAGGVLAPAAQNDPLLTKLDSGTASGTLSAADVRAFVTRKRG